MQKIFNLKTYLILASDMELRNKLSSKDNFEKIDTKIVFATIIELVDDKIEKKDIEEILTVLDFNDPSRTPGCILF